MKDYFFNIIYIYVFVCNNLMAQGGWGIQTFLPKEYHASFQNLSITQAKNGMIYVGNANGLLVWDGIEWRNIAINGSSPVISVRADTAADRVWLGGIGIIGYVDAANVYHSLLSRLPEAYQQFNPIWTITVSDGWVYFEGHKFIICYSKKADSIKVLHFNVNRIGIISDNNKNYLKLTNQNYYLELRGSDTLKAAGIDTAIWNQGIIKVLRKPDGSKYYYTTNSKILLEKDNKITAFAIQKSIGEYVKIHNYRNTLFLPDGNQVICTVSGGVIIVSSSGDWLGTFTIKEGLPDNGIMSAFLDNQGGIWLATNNGLARISYGSPLKLYNTNYGILGSVLCENFNQNYEYVGTMQGLFYRKRTGFNFKSLKGISNTEVWGIAPIDTSEVIVSSLSGIYHLVGDSIIKKISPKFSRGVFRSKSPRHKGVFICATTGGILRIRIDKEKKALDTLPFIQVLPSEVYYLVEDTITGVLYGTCINNQSFAVRFENEVPTVEFFTKEFMNEGIILVPRYLKDKIFFLLSSGMCVMPIYTPNKPTQFKKQQIKELFSLPYDSIIDGFYQLTEDRWWFNRADSSLIGGKMDVTGNWKFDLRMPYMLAMQNITNLRVTDSGQVRLCTGDGLIVYTPDSIKNDSLRKFDILLRKVQSGDSLIYTGGKVKPNWQFIYQLNSLRFEVAAVSYDMPKENVYRFLLENFDTKWSDWSTEHFRIYTNLPEGTYTLRVQAMNAYQYQGNELRITFTIMPPWYRTAVAYISYILLGGLAIGGIVRWQLYRLKAENVRLENLVNQRTAELRRSNTQLEQSYEEIRSINNQLQLTNVELNNSNEELNATLENLRATQHALVTAEKMAALGKLVANVAHEINTPMGAIRSSAHNMQQTLPQTLREMTTILPALPPEKSSLYTQFLEALLAYKGSNLSSREERSYRRSIENELKNASLPDSITDPLARLLAAIGFIIDYQVYMPAFVNLSPTVSEAMVLLATHFSQLNTGLENIDQATAKTRKIVYALKSFSSGGQAAERTAVEVKETITAVLEVYDNYFKQGIDVVLSLLADITVIANRDEMIQMWTNLIHNALQAMDYQGRLKIEMQTEKIDQISGIWVQISDSGKGIPESIMPRIFEPFFTTLPEGEGSGLGLYICQTIIQALKGKIEITSILGTGTTVRVWLPTVVSGINKNT